MPAKFGQEREVPGPRTKTWLERARILHFRTTVDSEVVVQKYEGPFVYDPDGNEYFDGASGVGINSLGGGDSLGHIWEVIENLKKNCGGCGDIGTDWYNTTMVDAAEYILGRITLYNAHNKIYFTGSGTQAVEAALKLVWDYHTENNPERTSIVVWDGAFHGRTGYSIKLIDPLKRVRVERYPMPDYDVIRAPFPSLYDPNSRARMKAFFFGLSREVRKKVAGVFFETIQGEGGIRVSDASALQWWVDAWRNEGATIVCDDIQCGLGRTGSLMSFEQFGVLPDMVTIGKHLGSGVPVAAMIGPDFMEWREKGRHSESFQGSPIAAAAAKATVRHILENEVLRKNKELGLVLERLMKNPIYDLNGVVAVRGMGLMWGVEFTSEELRNLVLKEGERLGLRLIGSGFSYNPTIRFMPPFVATERELEEAISILRQSIARANKKTYSK